MLTTPQFEHQRPQPDWVNKRNFARSEPVEHSDRNTLARMQQENTQEEFSFSDFIDVINPLQHLPIIGTIYRAITGDEISGPARVAGGILYGGVVGGAAAVAGAASKESTGKDLGEHALAALGFEDKEQAPTADTATQIAQARLKKTAETSALSSLTIPGMTLPEQNIPKVTIGTTAAPSSGKPSVDSNNLSPNAPDDLLAILARQNPTATITDHSQMNESQHTANLGQSQDVSQRMQAALDKYQGSLPSSAK